MTVKTMFTTMVAPMVTKSAKTHSADGVEKPDRSDIGLKDFGLKDIRAHNRESLDALLAHVDEQCRVRCEEIAGRARAEADRVRQAARDRAAELLREVHERERRNLDEQIRVERARQHSRIRQRELIERRGLAERGLELVREALVKHWNCGERTRASWLRRALADARAVLGGDRWQLHHPEDWSPDEATDGLMERVAPNVEIDWIPDPALSQGFVIGAGKAWVDATPAGLTARGQRIAGVLLAQLPESNSPERGASQQDRPAKDKEVTS